MWREGSAWKWVRLFWWLAFIWITLFAWMNPARAGTDIWSFTYSNCGGPTVTGATRSAVMSQMASVNASCIPGDSYFNWRCAALTGVGTSSSTSACNVDWTAPPNPTVHTDSFSISISCSAGKLLSASEACVATSGGACPTAGTIYSQGWYDIGTNPTANIVSYAVAPNSCGVSFSGTCPSGVSTVAGVKHYYCKGNYAFVGGSPDTSSTLTPTASVSAPAQNSCGTGQQGGYVNGNWVCLSTAGTGGTTSGQPASQSTSSTTVTNGDGSKTTTTTTTNQDGTVVVTTNTVSSTGQPISSTTSDPLANKDDVTKFCTANPTANICKTNTWSGSCGGFSFDGDAIEGAIAREVYQRNCDLWNSDADSVAGQHVVDGSDNQLATATAKTTVNISSSSIDQTAFLASSGLTDQVIAIDSTHSVTLPFSQLNSYLSIMGTVLVAVALIVAARIITGGKTA